MSWWNVNDDLLSTKEGSANQVRQRLLVPGLVMTAAGVVIMTRALSVLVAVAAAALMFTAPAAAQPKHCQVQCLSERNLSYEAWDKCTDRCMSPARGNRTFD
jgi:hypothetical protein